MEKATKEGLYEFLKSQKSIVNMIISKAKQRGDYLALTGYKDTVPYSFSWIDLYYNTLKLAKFLLDKGFKKGDKLAIFSQNCPEWTICDLGIQATGCAPIPVYATNSAEETKYIVDDAQIKAIFVGDQEQYNKARQIFDNTSLELIVSMKEDIKIDSDIADSLYSIFKSEISQEDENKILDTIKSIENDDLFTIIYTSGTTGNPKGAVHTHKSFLSGIYPSVTRFPEANKDKVSLAVLPLSHVFERMWTYGVLYKGGQNHYCPDPKKLIDILPLSKPHFMCSVPRIWEKVYGTIFDKLESASSTKKKLFNWATKTGIEYDKSIRSGKIIRIGMKIKRALADKLVLKKLRDIVGGRVIVFHVGGAAMSAEINEFFNGVGIPLAQGYGLTEFFPVAVGTAPTSRPGICGPVLDTVDVRISPEGEIQLYGEMRLKEYYNKPEATAEVFTEDGWFKTGDIGILEEHNGYRYIKITDRIKDLIITAGGKNISPQVIETMVGEDLYIEQVVVVGDGRKFVSALVVPNFEVLAEYAKNNNIEFKTREDLISNPKIIQLYDEKIQNATKSLGQVEKIKKFTLLTKEFTQEEGEITPTLKVKRKVIQQKYKDIIDKMYQE